jgi:hypothetical protein
MTALIRLLVVLLLWIPALLLTAMVFPFYALLHLPGLNPKQPNK